VFQIMFRLIIGLATTFLTFLSRPKGTQTDAKPAKSRIHFKFSGRKGLGLISFFGQHRFDEAEQLRRPKLGRHSVVA
jgi:hypothetical protein